jgi:hypothetical protein
MKKFRIVVGKFAKIGKVFFRGLILDEDRKFLVYFSELVRVLSDFLEFF